MKNDNSLRFLCILLSLFIIVSMRMVALTYHVPPSQITMSEKLGETKKLRKGKGKN